MKRSFVLLALAIFCTSPLLADEAKDAFDAGNALLKKGEVKAAMHKFVEAVNLDPGTTEYSTKLSWAGRTLRLEAMREKDKDNPENWAKRCRGLHMFYLALGMTKQAVENDRELCERVQDPGDYVRLAQALYIDKQFAEAVKVLESLGDDATPSSDAMLVLALDRDGKKKEAVELAKAIEVPESLSSATAYSLARVKALAGDAEKSTELLTALFEATAPVRLEKKKQDVVECEDFDGIRDTAEYKTAMKVESKMSGCSEGKSCATCPMRNQCQKGAGSADSAGTDMNASKTE